MKVKELISFLQKEDPEMIVAFDDDVGLCSIDTVSKQAPGNRWSLLDTIEKEVVVLK